jgi:thiopeptide-type bacteriocin biosynthesis protein
VTYDGHVLSPAEWNLDPARTEPLRKAKTRQDRWDAAQRLRSELALPRHLGFHERHDHVLPVDLDDPYAVEAWLDIAQEKMRLQEAFPVERSAVVGPEGPYHHHLVLPMFGDVPKSPSPPARPKPVLPRQITLDRVIPGGSPLYLSFGGDADELLAILRDVVEEVVRPMQGDGSVTHWFFLPFTNPDPQMRVRLFGDPSRLWSARTFAAIAGLLEPLMKQGVLKTVSYETYDRETYRYGGPEGVALAEHVFHLCSEMALDLHDGTVFDVEDDKELEGVIVPLVASLRAILAASDLPLPEQRALAEYAAEHYSRHSDLAVPRKQASDLYRKVRDKLQASGDTGQAQRDALHAVLAEARRLEMSRPFGEWVVDCLHVQSIRLLTTWHPIAHLETTCYHVLHRMLGTEIALRKG